MGMLNTDNESIYILLYHRPACFIMGGKDIKQTWYSWGRSTNGIVTVQVSNSLPNISVKSRQASIIKARKLTLGQSLTIFSVSTTFAAGAPP